MTAAIELHGITVRYGDVLALDDVHLSVAPGRVCGLLGMNGSGKSTLFKTLLGLVPTDHGRIRILGRSSTTARRKGLLVYVPQSEQVDWAFPVQVHDVVMMGRYAHMGPRRRPRAADREAVDHALRRTGLTELAGRQIGALSGGQRKRAFVARALAQGPDVLLLDEPFTGVDKRSEKTITELLLQLRLAGHTLLVSTHDLAQVPTLCDEAVLLQNRVIAHGPPEQVLEPDVLLESFGINPDQEETWTR